MKKIILALLLAPLFSFQLLGVITIDVNEDNKISVKYPLKKSFLIQNTNDRRLYTKTSLQASLNKEEYLVDEWDGYILGYLNENDTAFSRVKINTSETIFTRTKNVKLELFLPSHDPIGTVRSHEFTVYDSLVTPRKLRIELTKRDASHWQTTFHCAEVEEITFAGKPLPFEIPIDQEESISNLFEAENSTLYLRWNPEIGTYSSLAFKGSVVTAKGNEFLSSDVQDGIPFGFYQNFKIKPDGKVMAQFSNGVEREEATLVMCVTEEENELPKDR